MTSGQATNTPFDTAAFRAVVIARIDSLGISDRDAARQIGTSQSTVSRFRKGKEVEMQCAVSMAVWAGVDLEPFITRPAPLPGMEEDGVRTARGMAHDHTVITGAMARLSAGLADTWAWIERTHRDGDS